MSDPRFPTAQGVPNRSLWTVLSELGDDRSWQAIVYQLVIEAFPENSLALRQRIDDRLDEPVLRQTWDLVNALGEDILGEDINAFVCQALEFGALYALYGFALARAWPDSPAGLGDWPAAAWALADLDGWIVEQWVGAKHVSKRKA